MNVNTGGAVAPSLSPASWGGRLLKKTFQKKSIPNEPLTLTTTAEDSTFEVNLVDGETITVDLDRLRQNTKYGDILIQDVVKEICKQKEIAPNNAGFFGLKCEFSSGTSMWIVQTKLVKDVKQEKKKKFHFRLQFKVLFGQDLRKRDSNAYDYYLKQCRCDFKSGAFSKQLEGKDNEKILLRIVILEMMMLYQEVSKEEKVNQLKDMLKNKYRKYFSIEEILKKYYDRDGPRDPQRCRQKVEKSLNCFSKVTDPDKDFMTEIELLKNFRDEIFYLQKYERVGSEANQVELWISPKDVQKKVLISNIRTSLWEAPFSQLHHLKFCELDQKKGVKVMIIRGDEPPEVIHCANEEIFESICSFIDGYYRLLVNQYNSILNDSSQCLLRSPYFGPIHRDVAARILSNKGVERGTYLIREHTKHYGSYVLSLISNEHEFLHILILREEEDNKKFYSCGSKNFDTIEELCIFYGDTKNSDEIKGSLTARIHPKHAGCIPLYTDPANFRPILADRHSVSKMPLTTKHTQSQIIMLDDNDITEKKPIKQGTFGKVNISCTHDGRELVVKRIDAIKRDELLDLYNTLKSTQHENIVPLVGISLNDIFLAYEYMSLGSLQDHLLEKRNNITYGVLLRYLVQITDAVAFLHLQNCVHGDLSIGNIYMHDTNNVKVGNGCIKWKLASSKSVSELIYSKRFNFHAPEIILNENSAFTKESDIWSFGLTIWQLFTLDCPFRNYNCEQLRIFFTQHMESKIAQQPGLIHLNMHNLPFYTDEMFEMLNSCLKMESENRSTIEKIKGKVIEEILKKAASKDKKKYYFIHDWKDQNQYDDVPDVQQQNNNHHFPINIKKHSMDNDDYTSAGALSMNNGDSNNCLVDLSIVKNEISDMETSFCESDLKLNEEEHVGVKAMNGSSQSAPTSPNRPKLYRSNSLNDTNKRDDEDFETASILVDMSQTTLTQNEKFKRSQSLTKAIKPEVNPSLQSTCMLVGNPIQLPLNVNELPPSQFVANNISSLPTEHDVMKGMGIWAKVTNRDPLHLTSQPTSHPTLHLTSHPTSQPTPHLTSQPTSHPTSHPISHPASHQTSHPTSHPASLPMTHTMVHPTSQITSHSMVQSTHPNTSPQGSVAKETERNRFPQPHFPPPDSPEAVRREFATEHSKRDLPRNDRTRLYLQERINKERDRFHGKRSLSFTDEFEEYRNNTIRAAKRALLGPNPFNIGIQLPDDFLLRTDKRMCQTERSLPADVKRYFRNVQLGDNVITTNPNLEPYITVRELENRNKALNTDIKLDSNDHREAQVQTIRIGMEKMHTHSPIPANCEEKTKFPTEQVVSNTNGSTRSPLHIYNQPIPNSQHTMCFPFNPSISLSNQTSKSPNRNTKDTTKYIPAYPNMPYPINIPQDQLPVNFFPVNSSHILTAQRALSIQPNTQVQLSNRLRNTTVLLPNPARITNQSHQIVSTQKPVDSGIYDKNPVPELPFAIETDDFRQIDKNSLEMLHKLGTGAFGEVWKGVWKFTKNNSSHRVFVAIKRLIASDEPDYKKAVEDIHAEAKHLATLSNDNDPASQHIIKLYGLCLDDRMYQIVEEYAKFGQLDLYIATHKDYIKSGDILNYCKQVAVGMDYMHKKNVFHRDLACRNILVIHEGHIKISDFGMSRQPNKEYYRIRDVKKSKIPIKWCALESITLNTFTRETDCWSYGVAAWEMYTVFQKNYQEKQAKPYNDVEDVHLTAHLDKGNRLSQPSTCPDEIWKHISACWYEDPKERPTFRQFIALLNKFMKEIGYET